MRSERGFTLVEVMVAVLILLVGVAGTAAMMDGASATTSKNKGREGGTNVARSVVEIARSVPYRTLTGEGVVQALEARPRLGDARPGTAGHQVESRGFVYGVTVTACSMDDPKDGLGAHTSGISWCSDTKALAAGEKAKDSNPDDYRRVRADLSWTAAPGRSENLRQTALVTNPVGGLGPSVKELKPVSPSTGSISSEGTTVATFEPTTSEPAADVVWSVNGDPQGSASPDATKTSWTFDWQLAKADGTPAVHDGTYVLRAAAYDDEGRSGSQDALTVVVNRIPPLAPTRVEGGRNGNGSRVDVEWHPNPEGDILGYRVYRGTAPGELGELACPAAGASVSYITATSCLDETAPSVGPLYYTVVALDRAPDGSLREGKPSESVAVVEDNGVPTTPTGLTACTGGTPDCNGPDGQPAPAGTTVLTWNPSTDPDTGDAIYFYRVYRDGFTYADRYDRLYPTAGKPLVFVDSKTGGTEHSYRVTAVDKRFGESQLSEPVAR